MALILSSGPAVEPVSLAEAKAHCRVDISDDDTLIGNYIRAARQYVEEICTPRRALISQTWLWVADEWPADDTIELGVAPLASVTSVKYTDEDGVEATLAAANYLVDTYSTPGRLRLKSSASWPNVTLRELNGLIVTFVAGYGASSTYVPETFRQAMLLLIGNWYENREVQVVSGAVPKILEFALNALLAPYRMEYR